MDKPKTNLKQWMIFRKKEQVFEPLEVFTPEPNVVVGVYQGSFSKFDILKMPS